MRVYGAGLLSSVGELKVTDLYTVNRYFMCKNEMCALPSITEKAVRSSMFILCYVIFMCFCTQELEKLWTDLDAILQLDSFWSTSKSADLERIAPQVGSPGVGANFFRLSCQCPYCKT